MPEIDFLECNVRTPRKIYEFGASLFRSESPEEQRIDAGFYQKWAEKIHQGVHHEMQLLTSPIWGRVDPEVPIHVYARPESGESFVCYTPQVPTAEGAKDIFRQWCVGTVYAIEHKTDFASLAGQHPDDFLEFMAREFKIEIVE